MKKVYTFSIGGSRDDIYLESLSSSIMGIGNLVNDYFLELYTDREFSSIQLIGDKLLVWYIDTDLQIAEKVYFDLVSFNVYI